jgi:hypothetical protein
MVLRKLSFCFIKKKKTNFVVQKLQFHGTVPVCHMGVGPVGANFNSVRAFSSHCQIDCQISFDNCYLNFRDTTFDKLRKRMSRKLIMKVSF